jgi:hypothetical protein
MRKRESERAHSDGDPIDAALGVFRGVSQTPSCIPPFFFFFFFSSFIFYIFIYTYIFPSMSTQRIAAPEKLFFCLTVCVIIKSSGSFLHETFSSIPAHSRLKKKGIIITWLGHWNSDNKISAFFLPTFTCPRKEKKKVLSRIMTYFYYYTYIFADFYSFIWFSFWWGAAANLARSLRP